MAKKSVIEEKKRKMQKDLSDTSLISSQRLGSKLSLSDRKISQSRLYRKKNKNETIRVSPHARNDFEMHNHFQNFLRNSKTIESSKLDISSLSYTKSNLDIKKNCTFKPNLKKT